MLEHNVDIFDQLGVRLKLEKANEPLVTEKFLDKLPQGKVFDWVKSEEMLEKAQKLCDA